LPSCPCFFSPVSFFSTAAIQARYAALDGSAFDLTQDLAGAEAIGIPKGLIDNLCMVGLGDSRQNF
jgi:hypothetical protein